MLTKRRNDGQAENSIPPKLHLQGGGGGGEGGAVIALVIEYIQGCGNTMANLSDLIHYIQNKVENTIYLSWDKHKDIRQLI